MAEKSIEERLCEAAIQGCVESLKGILAENELVLDKVVVGRLSTLPLHTASYYGHLPVVFELLCRNQKLARVVDSTGQTALHLASAEGHVAVVKELIRVWPDMCLARDLEGRNPVHVAAMNGRVTVVEELMGVRPHAARARLDGGETILHLCVKHAQSDALISLLDLIEDEEFVQARDNAGNTVLHYAVVAKNLRIIAHLIEEKKIKVNTTNASGHTARDVLPPVATTRGEDDNKIESCLRKASTKRAKNLEQREWVIKNTDAFMVVASLIATIAFQAGVTPPGGVWQDDSDSHRAGEAVMAYHYPDSYPWFLRFSTMGFVASLSTILLLNSGLDLKKRRFMLLLMVAMWLTITSMAAAYAVAIVWVTPKKDRKSLTRTIAVAVIVFCSVMALLLMVHIFRLVCDNGRICEGIEKVKKVPQIIRERLSKCYQCPVEAQPNEERNGGGLTRV